MTKKSIKSTHLRSFKWWMCYSAWKTTWLIDHQLHFTLVWLIVSVLVNRTIRHTDLKLFERFVFRQLCTAALTWRISTWPKEAPSLSTTWSSTNRRPSTRSGTTWWTLSGQWAQTGRGPVGWSTETFKGFKGFSELVNVWLIQWDVGTEV